jgi:hypothetical protein
MYIIIIMAGKFGNKKLHRYAIGVKHGVHTAAVIGQKMSQLAGAAAPVAALAGNEPLAAGLEVGSIVGGQISNMVEKATR